MKLIIGLGNPGPKYHDTRHNAGFMFVDYLYEKADEIVKPWKFDKYSQSEISTIKFQVLGSTFQFLMVKPQTYMNKSGEAVSKLIQNSNLKSKNVNIDDQGSRFHVLGSTLFIAHDDLDLKLGEFKISFGKVPKQHNGIRSIEQHLKTNEFTRIRIGVDNRQGAPIDGESYVLSDFRKEERERVQECFDKILSQLHTHV